MARATLKLKRPITDFDIDADETSIESAGWVRVVRCKDCKHRNEYECDHIMLGKTKCGVTDDWFCADGERSEP